MPTWNDQIMGYYYPSYHDELYHHGIKGMKWGVRRYQNEDGTLTSAGRRRASEKTQDRIDKIQRKIDKHDSNVVMRNTVNDYRRGKIQELKIKQNRQKASEGVSDARKALKDARRTLREDKKAYKNGDTSKRRELYKDRTRVRNAKNDLLDARNKLKRTAFVENVQNYGLSKAGKAFRGGKAATRIASGGYERRRNNGERVVSNLLKSTAAGIATVAVAGLAAKGATTLGKKAADAAIDAILNEAIRRQRDAHIPKLDSGMITGFKYKVY